MRFTVTIRTVIVQTEVVEADDLEEALDAISIGCFGHYADGADMEQHTSVYDENSWCVFSS